MIAAEAVSVRRGGRAILDAVTIRAAAGRVLAVLGPNGAGKSTLFALLTRLFVAPSGTIQVAGHDLSRAPLKALAAMGVVFQQPTLDLDLTVRRNLLYFAALHGLSGREAQSRVTAALEQLGMAERAGELVRTLNGGHRRRMELARALAHRPAVLLLDEPLEGLAPVICDMLMEAFGRLAASGAMTILFVEQRLESALAFADDVIILERGRIVWSGKPDALRADAGVLERYIGVGGLH